MTQKCSKIFWSLNGMEWLNYDAKSEHLRNYPFIHSCFPWKVHCHIGNQHLSSRLFRYPIVQNAKFFRPTWAFLRLRTALQFRSNSLNSKVNWLSILQRTCVYSAPYLPRAYTIRPVLISSLYSEKQINPQIKTLSWRLKSREIK